MVGTLAPQIMAPSLDSKATTKLSWLSVLPFVAPLLSFFLSPTRLISTIDKLDLENFVWIHRPSRARYPLSCPHFLCIDLVYIMCIMQPLVRDNLGVEAIIHVYYATVGCQGVVNLIYQYLFYYGFFYVQQMETLGLGFIAYGS
jgi:hypothetical protein